MAQATVRGMRCRKAVRAWAPLGGVVRPLSGGQWGSLPCSPPSGPGLKPRQGLLTSTAPTQHTPLRVRRALDGMPKGGGWWITSGGWRIAGGGWWITGGSWRVTAVDGCSTLHSMWVERGGSFQQRREGAPARQPCRGPPTPPPSRPPSVSSARTPWPGPRASRSPSSGRD